MGSSGLLALSQRWGLFIIKTFKNTAILSLSLSTDGHPFQGVSIIVFTLFFIRGEAVINNPSHLQARNHA